MKDLPAACHTPSSTFLQLFLSPLANTCSSFIQIRTLTIRINPPQRNVHISVSVSVSFSASIS